MTGSELAISMAGLTATVITSGLGLYFTFRARTAPYRDQLYQHQMALVTDILETMAGVDALCGVVLTVTEEPGRNPAWIELQDQLSRTALLVARAAALLPNSVYGAFGEYHGVAVGILVDTGAGATDKLPLSELRARSARLMELARALLGVEALSAGTQSLVSNDSLERVARTDLSHYLAIVKRAEREETGLS